MSMTPAQAKRRFREFEDTVYNPARAWLRKYYPDAEAEWMHRRDEKPCVMAVVLDNVLLNLYRELSAPTREPQDMS